MLTVKELKALIESLPDDAIVVNPDFDGAAFDVGAIVGHIDENGFFNEESRGKPAIAISEDFS